MQKILPNSRQMPKTKFHMAHRGYSDNIYGYLVGKSHWDGIVGQPRYLYKNQMNYTAIAKQLGISRQTVSTRIRHMLKGEQPKKNESQDQFIPLIEYDEQAQIYKLIPFENDLAFLVNNDTLLVMVSLLRDHAISAYIYLYNVYYANNCQKFQFTYPRLKQQIGVGSKSRGNNSTITAILFGLSKLGLLKYQICTTDQNRAYITWMTNEIKDAPKFDQLTDEKQKEIQNIKARYNNFFPQLNVG